MDDKGLPIGSHQVFELMKNSTEGFSVEFYKGDGHLVKLNDCERISNAKHIEASGLEYITVAPRDNRVHPYPIYIRLLMKFNGQLVYQG